MEMNVYGAKFHTDKQADWVVDKLTSYGIKAWRDGKDGVVFITTPKRYETLNYLFAWWTGLIHEWWFRLDMSWYTNHRNYFPGACVEAMMYGTERSNIFAFNEDMKRMYRERHARRHWK